MASEVGDMALAYQRAADGNAQAHYDGQAIKAAFDRWFSDRDRVRLCDMASLESYDALVATGEVSGAFRRLRNQDLQEIGFLPGGANYLAGRVLAGPWYEDISDAAVISGLDVLARETAAVQKSTI